MRMFSFSDDILKKLTDDTRPIFEHAVITAYKCGLKDADGQKIKQIRADIEARRDEWKKGTDPEWHTYDRCLWVIDQYTKGDSK